MSAPSQFRKKPVVISAIQWDGENLVEVIHFMDGRPPNNKSSHASMMWDQYVHLVRVEGLKIFTLEGKMDAAIGDWIIKGVKGEHYPCKPEIFTMTYEPAASIPAPSTDYVAGLEAAIKIIMRVWSSGDMDDEVQEIIVDDIRALRANLDAQAGVTVKPLVFADENGDGVLTSRETGRLKRVFPQDGGRFLAPSLATDLFKTPEDAIAAYQADHGAFVLRCIEPTHTPLAEAEMRERAANVVAEHQVYQSEICANRIRALPTTFTHAELLAAAEKLPEVKALVDATRCADETFRDLAWHQKWEFTSAALAPFTRKGE